MENNKSNRLLFFGAYLFADAGCNAALFQPSENSRGKNRQLVMSPSILADIHEGTFSSTDFYLKLKPLSSISDEDAIEVAKCSDCFCDEDLEGICFYKVAADDILFSPKRGHTIVLSALCRDQVVSDLLRSRGYLLPFHDLSTEQLIAYGWAKTE